MVLDSLLSHQNLFYMQVVNNLLLFSVFADINNGKP
jgi:hypothetical protein